MPQEKEPEDALLAGAEDTDTFVRTFATDAAALEKGEKPDFTRKEGAEPAPAEPARAELLGGIERAAAQAAAASSLDLDAEASATPPAPLAPQRADVPPLPASLIPAGSEKPLVPGAPAPSAGAPLHTYTGDFAEKVEAEHASQADILAAEADAPREGPAVPPARDRRLFLLAGVLIVLGLLGAGAAYWYVSAPPSVVVPPAPQLRIFVDETATLTGSGGTLLTQIQNSVANPPAAGAVRLLALASSSVSVFEALQLPAPDILSRNLESAGSLAGVLDTQDGASPFFILAVDSYSDTFAGMLQWEPTMGRDLSGLYPPGSGSESFKDETILNHDVRALVDSAGHTVLLYGYFDQNTLLIARDELAFGLLLDRLTNSHTEQE